MEKNVYIPLIGTQNGTIGVPHESGAGRGTKRATDVSIVGILCVGLSCINQQLALFFFLLFSYNVDEGHPSNLIRIRDNG